jgi:hypothetical protein
MSSANESIKKYYANLIDTLGEVNREEEFYEIFLNAIRSGQTTFYQKFIQETRVFDDTWIKNIEAYIPSIDAIIRNPKTFIKVEKEVVAVERAKKINSDSVRHLAVNSQFIKEVTEEGDIIPMKILTTYGEEDLGIYENRFVKSLIDKLFYFVDSRYNKIVESIQSNKRDQLKVNSSFKWYKTDIDWELNVNVREITENDELESKNNDLLERIKKLRMISFAFKNSQFMKALSHAKPVRPPIMKTNILLKNVDYKQAYKLWLFLDMYNSLGFDIDVVEKNLQFDGTYMQDIYNLIVSSYSTMFVNQKLGELDFNIGDYKKRRFKRPKILNKLTLDTTMKPGEFVMEDRQVNEFFFQQAHSFYSDQVKGMIEDGVSKRDAFKHILNHLSAIISAFTSGFIDQQIEEQEDDDKSKDVDAISQEKAKLQKQKAKLDLMKLTVKARNDAYTKALNEEKKLEQAIKKSSDKLAKMEKKAKEAKIKLELKKKKEAERQKAIEKARKEKLKKQEEAKKAKKLELLEKEKARKAALKAEQERKRLADQEKKAQLKAEQQKKRQEEKTRKEQARLEKKNQRVKKETVKVEKEKTETVNPEVVIINETPMVQETNSAVVNNVEEIKEESVISVVENDKEGENMSKGTTKKSFEDSIKAKISTIKLDSKADSKPISTYDEVEVEEKVETKKEEVAISINDPRFANVDKSGIETDEQGNLTPLGLKEIRERKLKLIEKARKKKETYYKKHK